MKERVLGGGGQLRFNRRQLDDLDTFQRPAMGMGDFLDFFPSLGKADVQNLFAGPGAFEKKLEGERGLAAARLTLNQVEPARREASTEDVVQS